MPKELIARITAASADMAPEDEGLVLSKLLAEFILSRCVCHEHAEEGVEVYAEEIRRAVNRHFERENWNTPQ